MANKLLYQRRIANLHLVSLFILRFVKNDKVVVQRPFLNKRTIRVDVVVAPQHVVALWLLKSPILIFAFSSSWRLSGQLKGTGGGLYTEIMVRRFVFATKISMPLEVRSR